MEPIIIRNPERGLSGKTRDDLIGMRTYAMKRRGASDADADIITIMDGLIAHVENELERRDEVAREAGRANVK